MKEELVLLHRAKQLDEDALTEIHERYYVSIYRYIAFRVNDRQTAEDLTSDVFVRLLTAIRDHSAPRKTLRGWLYGVASNVVKEHYRQKNRRQQTQLHEGIPSFDADPDDHLESVFQSEQIQMLIKELTEEQQQVLALRFGFEMPIKEVADTMGKSEGSVKMLQARAIASLSRHVMAAGAFA
ncbi:MAG: sigma-70 family RNA polymerase sigma factor [Candidatus Promineifilaceae bacterium]